MKSEKPSKSPDKKGWPIYAQLLSDLFKFIGPYLREHSNRPLSPAFQKMYDGMLRLILARVPNFYVIMSQRTS